MRVLLISLTILFSSCSNLERAQIYAGITGALICGFAGNEIGRGTSPNMESERLNGAMGAVAGGTGCYYAGKQIAKYFYNEDPENVQGEPVILNQHMSNRNRLKSLPEGNANLKELGIILID